MSGIWEGELTKDAEIENYLIELKHSVAGIKGGTLEKDAFWLDVEGKITLDIRLKAKGENYLLFKDVHFYVDVRLFAMCNRENRQAI